MKKLMTTMLAAGIMFAVAGQAKAAALETSGEYRARYWYLDNYFVNKQAADLWDQRLRLNAVWPIAEGVKLQFRADIMEDFWGDFSLAEATPATDPKTFTAVKTTRTPIAFDWVNLTVAVPAVPGLTFQVGRQDASWGTGLFVKADNRDRFKLTYKVGDWTALYTYDNYIEVKTLQGSNSLDDRRQHSAGALGKVGDFNAGVIVAAIVNNTDPAVDSLIWGPDVFVMGKAGMVDLKFEACYLTGKNDNKDNAKDQDLQGIMAYLGASMPAGPVNVGLEAVYVSGDKIQADGTSGKKNEGLAKQDYQGPFSSVILFHNMDNDAYSEPGGLGAATDTNLSNAIAGKLSVSAAPAKGFNVMGAVVYATREQVAPGVKKPMGTEINLVCNYAITENVTWTVGAGYLMTGDNFKAADGKTKEDVLAAVSAFTVKF